MSDAVDVAIVGAGPYGLSLAAHLRAAGVSLRQFGLPMQLWQSAMPAGMFLKSQGFASNLSSPDGEHTLEAFCRATGRQYGSCGVPIPLDTFVAYGLWFQQELVPGVEHTLVTDVAKHDEVYHLALASGATATARNLVVAVGVEHFAQLPDELAALPAWACTHSSAHSDLAAFRGRSVVVVGAGQSALESAALLHESGADVQLVARRPKLSWNTAPPAVDRPVLARLREPEEGLGSGWPLWVYARYPDLFRRLPQGPRVQRARTVLGPSGAYWLPPRVVGKFPVLLGQSLSLVKADGASVLIGIEGTGTVRHELTADHVIAATGYRADLARLTFLGDTLRQRVQTVAGTPAVDRAYESSVPGLYFMGPAVAPTFGPLMRFVYGSDHAARAVSRRLARTARSSRRRAVRPARTTARPGSGPR